MADTLVGIKRRCHRQHADLLCRQNSICHKYGAFEYYRTDFSGYLVAYFSKNANFSKTSYRIAYRHCWRPCHNSAWQYFTANKIKLRSWRFLAFAVYSLLQIKRPQQISQSVMLTATAIVGTIIILPIMLLENTPNSLLQLNAEDLGVILYLGIFNSILAYLAWNISLAKIGNLKAGIIYYLLPIFSGIEAALILGEKIYPSEIAGGALIILGIMLTNMPNNKSARQLN